ncbi:MAG: hypothetical protein ACK56F_07305, partial [bacterium]
MLLGTLFTDALHRDMMPSMFPPATEAPRAYVRLFLRALGAAGTLVLLIIGALMTGPTVTMAQGAKAPAPTTLSLADALTMAARKNEGVAIAAAGVQRARGQQAQVDAQRKPQIAGTVAYQRAIQNQFAEITQRFSNPDDSSSGGGGFTD